MKVVVYLTDIQYRETVYRTMGRWLKGVYPVSTGVVVSALARPEWLVEIDATAVICSSSPAVAARCVHLADGAGAVLTQNVTDPRLGPKLIGLLGEGADAAAAIATVVASEPFTEFRQLIVLDDAGRAAIHSGSDALGVVGQYAVDGAAAAGNLLATPEVPQRMVEAWLTTGGPVEARLLAAFAAAMEQGGETGPVHSAGLSVVNGSGWRVTDLRVDWSEDPLADLTALLGIWLPQRDAYITRALNPLAAPAYGVPGNE